MTSIYINSLIKMWKCGKLLYILYAFDQRCYVSKNNIENPRLDFIDVVLKKNRSSTYERLVLT